MRHWCLLASFCAAASLPTHWKLLGPFPVGPREQGYDPIKGGFTSLVYNKSQIFLSELSNTGYVSWFDLPLNSDNRTVGPISYKNVDWSFNQQSFGWSANQHYTFATGSFGTVDPGAFLVSFSNIIAFKIDDSAYVGNIYDYKHASASPIWLNPGVHNIYICISWDIRIFGNGIPSPHFEGHITAVPITTDTHGVIAFPKDTIIPEILNDQFITRFASVTILNANTTMYQTGSDQTIDTSNNLSFQKGDSLAQSFEDAIIPPDNPANERVDSAEWYGWVEVTSVECITDTNITVCLSFAPGQIFPVPFEFIFVENYPISLANVSFLTINVHMMDLLSKEQFVVCITMPSETEKINGSNGINAISGFPITHRVWGEVFALTYLGYDGAVQYSMVRPPKRSCVTESSDYCPVIVALHGAGVEASSLAWTEAYDQRDDAWILFPTGRTSWGFDWHGSSFQNIESSLDILDDLPGVPASLKPTLAADISKLVYTGHSNGGHGAWWMLGHYPDRAIGAIAVSAYVKVQLYVGYALRGGDAFADPILRGVRCTKYNSGIKILESSIAENDVDLYTENMRDIPIFARTGSLDDNVPPIHTRRMARLMNNMHGDLNQTTLSIVSGQGHWFDGVVDDDDVEMFMNATFVRADGPPPWNAHYEFSIVTLNPSTSGPKNGISILQLHVPFRLGKIDVKIDGNIMTMKTTNIRRFQFHQEPRWKNKNRGPNSTWNRNITTWHVDNTEFQFSPTIGPTFVCTADDRNWVLSSDFLWISEERHSSTYGPALQVLSQPFLIVIPSLQKDAKRRAMFYRAAVHIATSWYLFARGGTQIVLDSQVYDGDAARYNMIVLGGPDDNLWTRRREKEGGHAMVAFLAGGGFKISNREFTAPGTGIIFLGPSPTRTRMGLFIAGTDEAGFQKAVWSIPFRTGMMVPDYMILGDEYNSPESGWTFKENTIGKGAGGILAAGYWSNFWEYEPRSGYLK